MILPTLLAMTLTPGPPVATAPAPGDPAVARIEGFYAALLDTMKRATTETYTERVARLQPEVDKLFNFPVMAQFAVGARWSAMSAADRRSIIEALSSYTARSYASAFSTLNGESLRVEPLPAIHGLDEMVRSEVASGTAAASHLNYRMRSYGGSWKVIDVYLNAVSQVTLQRSEFASTLATGGAPALVQKLDAQYRRSR